MCLITATPFDKLVPRIFGGSLLSYLSNNQVVQLVGIVSPPGLPAGIAVFPLMENRRQSSIDNLLSAPISESPIVLLAIP